MNHAQRNMILALLLVLFMAALGGCQTLWIHPEATSDKYERDVYYCRFGVERLPADATPEEQRERAKLFAPYQVNEALMDLAAGDALYMHCLPAHRGEEISAGLMDSAGTIIWEEAENRLHAQKALMETLLQANQ